MYHAVVKQTIVIEWAEPIILCQWEHRPEALHGVLQQEIQRGIHSFHLKKDRDQFVVMCNRAERESAFRA